jgi:aspartate/methionine/tyrosine aminotransferase
MLVDGIADSPILSLIDQIFTLRQRGETILGLHIGEPDFDTPRGIREAACRALEQGQTHYTSAQGLPQLREALAARLRDRFHIPSEAERLVILPAKFAIYATLLSTVGSGEEVLLPDPTYLFEQPVRLAGARPVYFPLREDFSLDPQALESRVTGRSRALFLVTPGNPTGRILRRAEVQAALEVARRHHLTVVSDETYASLVYEGTFVSPASLAPNEVPVVTIGSFSKEYAMTGWRIGFANAPLRIARRMVKVMEHTLTCLPPFIQWAALWALEHGQEDAAGFLETFRRRRDLLCDLLAEVPGLECPRPEGAFYVFPRFRVPMTSVEFSQALLQEAHVAVVPGIAFGPQGEHHLRLSYTAPEEVLREGVSRIREFLAHRASTSE